MKRISSESFPYVPLDAPRSPITSDGSEMTSPGLARVESVMRSVVVKAVTETSTTKVAIMPAICRGGLPAASTGMSGK